MELTEQFSGIKQAFDKFRRPVRKRTLRLTTQTIYVCFR